VQRSLSPLSQCVSLRSARQKFYTCER
jgi:hypothetical protein